MKQSVTNNQFSAAMVVSEVVAKISTIISPKSWTKRYHMFALFVLIITAIGR